MQDKLMRPPWPVYFMEAARLASQRSNCLRRQVGAVAVIGNRIVATGYNGAPARTTTCLDLGSCLRAELKVASGQRHELCRAVHAEANVVTQAAQVGVSLAGATLYCTHAPCSLCAKLIINSGITGVVSDETYPDEMARGFFKEAGIDVYDYHALDAVEDYLCRAKKTQ